MLISIVFCSALSMLSFADECREIRGSVLRLHILANSDTVEDQQLKLAVRDRLLTESCGVFSGASDLESALYSAEENMESMRNSALDEIRAHGYDYDVDVRLEDTYFTTRTYGKYTLPAGKYKALRVVIGEGKGHNWWCVMFPPICISPSAGGAAAEDVLDGEQLGIVEGDGYDVRFKCVEYLERIFGNG